MKLSELSGPAERRVRPAESADAPAAAVTAAPAACAARAAPAVPCTDRAGMRRSCSARKLWAAAGALAAVALAGTAVAA